MLAAGPGRRLQQLLRENSDVPGKLLEVLEQQEDVWKHRPLLRRLYRDWYDLIVARLSKVAGPTVEFGAGTAHFKEAYPEAVATDIETTPWADQVVDALRLPYEDGSLRTSFSSTSSTTSRVRRSSSTSACEFCGPAGVW